ncbi:hypothetical protein GGTG_11389 [Gaeumannomyces tritici R3-111a-1]|uniref:Uncharacterized protein n=1 Tax=Gaeumannomyces tritici (strain R3-111a-1) TaxID=644352 RepID=J3PD16_GAET3|nr:hypothetical protein GGTG_11389 [Gaeumannomyces tritici R3-111a-1]EJT70361.1 hypothetical protein GGTG_11389 [Gaeumannomyces tritici R3-111a-1]
MPHRERQSRRLVICDDCIRCESSHRRGRHSQLCPSSTRREQQERRYRDDQPGRHQPRYQGDGRESLVGLIGIFCKAAFGTVFGHETTGRPRHRSRSRSRTASPYITGWIIQPITVGRQSSMMGAVTAVIAVHTPERAEDGPRPKIFAPMGDIPGLTHQRTITRPPERTYRSSAGATVAKLTIAKDTIGEATSAEEAIIKTAATGGACGFGPSVVEPIRS